MFTKLAVLGLVVTLGIAENDVVDPGPNTPDEQLADSYSLNKAFEFLDSASIVWQRDRKCMTCHTNYAYLMTIPAIDPDREAVAEVRSFAEGLVRERWKEKGPRWDAEVVMTAAGLAISDHYMSNELHPVTREALDKMWTLQAANGSWDWLKCGWPPMESDDDYGVAVALLAAVIAPDNYAQTPIASKGIAKALSYLEENPPPTLHHRAMLLWASKFTDQILTPAQQKKVVDELMAKQNEDGGWALASFGDWKRADGSSQKVGTSDGYGTGFVIYLARLHGTPATDPRLQQGIGWLKKNQRASGRWFTRSLNKDSKHFITHAGSAFAVLALASCEQAVKSE